MSAQEVRIRIPHNYQPRDYQDDAFNALRRGFKRIVCVWHRRAGKDKTMWNLLIKESQKRVGAYYYFFPTYKQGRKIIWDGMDFTGFKFLDHIPEEMRAGKPNDTEMKIRLRNGSLIQVIGTDSIDAIVGTNPVGCVFSEFALQDINAWDFIRPILVENNGWAVFIFTPRGHNHGWNIYDMARKNLRWFCELLTIDDTQTITADEIEEERQDGMTEDLINQEFFCSFEASIPGAYFANEMRLMREQNRICRVAIEPNIPVDTYWDLGIDDLNVIWFCQDVAHELHLVDYYCNSGEGLVHYVNYLKDWRDKHRVTFGTHVLPHDGKSRQLQTGKTSVQFLEELGLKVDTAARPQKKESGIETSRQMLSKCWIDEEACKDGIEALTQYRKEYDEQNRVYKVRPVHDIHKHGADAFQTLALWHQSQPAVKGETHQPRSRILQGVNPEQSWMAG